jgi:tetratricopeptide (TPR) repeat protein
VRRRAPAALAWLLLAAAGLPACEKTTHRLATRAFQDLMGRHLPAEERAAGLRIFVRRFPEPKTNPYLGRALALLADHETRTGRPGAAASWMEEAARAFPDDPDALNALGYHYARHGFNLDRAVGILETAVRLAERRGDAPRKRGFIKDSLGWALRVRGDLQRASAELEEADRLAPGVPILREHLADTCRARGEHRRAAAIYLDLYLQDGGRDDRLRGLLEAITREGGPAVERFVAARLRDGAPATVAPDAGASGGLSPPEGSAPPRP